MTVFINFIAYVAYKSNYKLVFNQIIYIYNNKSYLCLKNTAPLSFFMLSGLLPMPKFANRYDIVIDELMADPTPQISLPNNEWINYATSSTAFNLLGWRIGDATGQSNIMPSLTICAQ
ncbi:MAG: hypothetical protein IPI88_15585 [Chitinophagaceae bacterium]|nr:hypothetical protein [Chitinophagaceae bacterium]